MNQPFLWPLARVAIAFSTVFGLAGLFYFLMGLNLFGIVFYLVIGALTILTLAITTRGSIAKHYGARSVSKEELPRVNCIVDELSGESGMLRPRLLLVPSDEPNAFTFGFGKRTYIGVTQGLLTLLDDRELRAVLAHEFAHIWNRDGTTRTLSIALAKTLFAFAMLLAILIVIVGMVVVAVLLSLAGSKSKRTGRTLMVGPLVIALGVYIMSPVIISTGYFFFSRSAEFRADGVSVRFTGRPSDLISALVKIDNYPLHKLSAEKHGVYSSIWLASEQRKGLLGRLLSSHPPVEERVRRLMKMAHGGCECLAAPSMARFGIPPKPAHSGPWRERCSDVVNSAPVRETEHEPVVRGPRPRGPMESSSRRYEGVREPVPSIIDGIVTYERPDRHTYSMR